MKEKIYLNNYFLDIFLFLQIPLIKVYFTFCSLENKRRSKHISRTLNPQWHQTVMFQDLHREELQNKMLEITVWDYDRFKTNDFLGEVIIDLSGMCCNYHLTFFLHI